MTEPTPAPPRRHRFRKFVGPLLVVLLLLVVLMFGFALWPLHQARSAWMAGHDAQAVELGEQWARLGLWPAHYHQLLAAAYLTAGNPAAAAPHLKRIGHLRKPVIPKDELARRLFAKQRYADFLTYDAVSQSSSDSPDIALYRAAALVASNRTSEAAQAFARVDRGSVNGARYAALQRTITARASGVAPYVFDRNGNPIASLRLDSNQLTATDPLFASLMLSSAGSLTVGSRLGQLGTSATLETTLDPFVQKAALAAMGNFRGSLVAIDPRTNEILAIVSTPGRGEIANLALEHQYEPGSVVKVLTGLKALSGGTNLNAMFPYTCKGELMIDGRHFGDWLPQGHGKLMNIDDALSVSCNVFFADVGIRMGRDRLRHFMNTAGFDSQVDLGLFTVPLGKTVGRIFNNFETGFYAIGLAHESMNALHVAMVASMVANHGMMTTPILLRERHTILGDLVAKGPAQAKTQVASPEAADAITRSMQAVTTASHGTGRRAPVEGMSLAMKTGTAGERKSGLEALILAFAPAESPKIAFGIIAEDAGPAEYAGAKIAHDFLVAMKPRL